MELVLASSSVYRRERLQTLGLPFISHSPNIDESPIPNEQPADLVERLAIKKAEVIAEQFPNARIISSDQVAVCHQRILGKAGTQEKAIEQLHYLNGEKVIFYTSLCLVNTVSRKRQICVEPFEVHFRTLSESEIVHYVQRENPIDCAGSFKSEGLGITLFKQLIGHDPNTLIGLPLIKLTEFLINDGLNPLA